MALSEFGVDLALHMQGSVHHEDTKAAKVSDSLNSDLRATIHNSFRGLRKLSGGLTAETPRTRSKESLNKIPSELSELCVSVVISLLCFFGCGSAAQGSSWWM